MEDYLAGQSFDNELEEKFFKDIDEVNDIYLWGENIVSEVLFASDNIVRYAPFDTNGTAGAAGKIVKNATRVVAGTLSWFGSLRLRQIRSKAKKCNPMYPDSVKNDRGNECFYQYYGDGVFEDYIDTSPIVGTKTGKIYEYQNYMKNTLNSGDVPTDEGRCHMKKVVLCSPSIYLQMVT